MEGLGPTAALNACKATDAAVILLESAGPLPAGKVHALLLLAQAWHLVWGNELLFTENIIATPHGVRITEIKRLLGRDFLATAEHFESGHSNRVSEEQKRTLIGVLRFYGSTNRHRLLEAICLTPPWKKARADSRTRVIQPIELLKHYRNE